MLAGWEAGQARDVQQDMARLTLEVVAETLLGADVAPQAAEFGAIMDTLMECFSAGRSLFGLLPLPPTPREAAAVRRLDRLVDGLIADASPAVGEETTLLSHLRAGPGSARALREQVKTFLAAGHESSALALTWAFLMLVGTPRSGCAAGGGATWGAREAVTPRRTTCPTFRTPRPSSRKHCACIPHSG